jgi:hypothetical protein
VWVVLAATLNFLYFLLQAVMAVQKKGGRVECTGSPVGGKPAHGRSLGAHSSLVEDNKTSEGCHRRILAVVSGSEYRRAVDVESDSRRFAKHKAPTSGRHMLGCETSLRHWDQLVMLALGLAGPAAVDSIDFAALIRKQAVLLA